MVVRENYTPNIKVSGTSGNDSIWNGADNVTISSGKGNDSIHNTLYGYSVTINAGAGNDSVYNEGSDATDIKINGEAGSDTIISESENATIDGGSDNDEIYSYGASVSINGNSGNDTIYSDIGGSEESGSSITITGGSGDDFIDSDSPFSIIDGGTGNDDIVNYGWETSINGGAGNDVITNYNLFHIEGSKVTINGGKGNDRINIENATNNLIQYANGDGNDIIYGVKSDSTVQIATNSGYTTQKSGNDLIIKVGNGKMTFKDSANTPFKIITASIPLDAFEYNGHSYYIYSDVANTWEEAQAYCEARGGHLAVINDETENNAVFNYMKSKGYNSAYFGLSDAAKEGTWTWVNGDSSTYRNWASGEPNSERSNEDYAEFYYKFSDGKWNDGNFKQGTVGDTNAFICEWDTNSKAEENKSLLGAVEELMDKISDSEFTDLIEKLTNIASEWGNVEEAGLIKSTIEYLKKVREVFKNPNSDLSGQAKLWELSGASVKEFANFYGVINKHTNATNPLLWGDAAERNIKVLTMAADILSVKASFVSAKAELKEENLLAAITNYADAFRGFGDIALDAYALISKNKNPWNVAEVGVALYKSAVSILEQSTKSHQRYYADGKWDLNDTARFLMDVSMAGIYGITHSLSKEADDIIWDWIIGDDLADSDLTTSEKLSAKLNNLGNNIGNAIGKFGVNVGKALGNMWKQLNTLGYLTGQNIAKAGLNIGNAIGNLLKGAFNKEVVYINADGEVISSSENAVASITMSKTKFTCKALKNTSQNLSLGSKNDTSDWVITTKSGNDKIICASNKNVTVKSGSGNDTVRSTGKGNLYVEAGKGNDSIVGNAGNDKLYGGDGADTLKGGKGNDTLTGGAGKDVFIYTAGNDVITDYATGDKISLNASVSSASVKGADATFKIGSNTLTVKNGKGKKIIFENSKSKEREIIGGAFLATNSTSKNNTLASWREVADASERTKAIKIVGNAKDNIILGGSANDSLYGGSGKDSILGNEGKDKLYGQAGNDILKGGAGNDSLWGGAGNDSLWGDAGKDTFIYASGEGKDVIYGFENNDLLKITGAFSASYSKSKGEVYFKVGTTSKAITLSNFSASSFNVNGDIYQISGTKLVKK